MSKVYISKTSPKSVLKDYSSLLKKDGLLKNLSKNKPVILKLNLSWTKFYPACSSPPWQVEGVVKTLIKLGWKPENIIPVENKTVVTNVREGAKNHCWISVLSKYGVKIHYLTDEKYIKYKPKAKMLVLNKIFPEGIYLPKIIFNKNLLSLCTMKTHVFTTTTGAMKNYFGMLNTKRHYAHRFIHKALVDLLQIQKEIHPKIVGIMDGSIVGSGPGPRAMKWHEKNYLLASNDLVALDSTATKMMGFNPHKIGYLTEAEKLKLGTADPKNIQVVGEKIDKINFGFKSKDTFASRGQKLIYRHSPYRIEKLLLQTTIAPWSYLASRAFFDGYWYNMTGKARVKKFLKSPWGKLFATYLKDN